MSFRIQAHYLIEPRPEFAEWLQDRTDSDFAQILLETVLIHNEEGGLTTWGNESQATKIKLLYLARMREYTPLTSTEDAMRILGSDRVSTTVFDKWWMIRRVDDKEDAQDLVQFMQPVCNKIDPPTDELVKAWLHQILQAQKAVPTTTSAPPT